MKELSEMTLEELWRLFPIALTEANSSWKEWFEEEKQALLQILGDSIKIHHIGSTAIEGIWAKPIIDILIEVESREEMHRYACILENHGYIVMNESSIPRISLNKGYTKLGFAERVVHIHIHLIGDKDEVYFRDYLKAHKDVAKEYEALKLSLWKQFEYDRDGYTRAKTNFVRKYTRLAKSQSEVKNDQ